MLACVAGRTLGVSQVNAPNGLNRGRGQTPSGTCRQSWARFQSTKELDDVCPAVLLKVRGYSSIHLGANLPTNLAAGHYRLVKEFALSVDGYSAPLRDISVPFEVR